MEDKTKLYVGGLPYETTEQELSDAFAEVGTVKEAAIISDRFSGRSKGFGFVTMSSEEEAQAAIDRFHEAEFGGRKLTVNVARPKTER